LKSRITTLKNKPNIQEEQEEQEVEEPREDIQQQQTGGQATKIKRRCRNWPNCKLGDACNFHHPTEPCKFFPKCSYGDECLMIHPAIPCKFGAYCARPDCAYLHPHAVMGKFPGMPGKFAQPYGMPSMKPKSKPTQENNVAS